MTKLEAKDLLDRYVAGKCTAEEEAQIVQWIELCDNEGASSEQLTESDLKLWIDSLHNDILTDIAIYDQKVYDLQRRRTWIKNLSAAAVLLLVCALGFYLYFKKAPVTNNAQLANNKSIPHAHSDKKAILTLADGSRIALDDQQAGVLAKQGNVVVNKDKDGKLVYHSNGRRQQDTLQYNTVTTPRGRQCQLTLPDGTRVWMNAATTLKYPVEFTGNDRKVELSGEAYFEVSKNKDKPFKVSSRVQTLEVLGTSFNISSYVDEKTIETTLLTGAVRVTHSKSNISKVLKPGQRSIVAPLGSSVQVGPADIEGALAWKQGYFVLDNEDLKSIMLKVSRWYDMDVEYVGEVSDVPFGGTSSMSKDISEVLKMLEGTGVAHFKVVGRRIIVMK